VIAAIREIVGPRGWLADADALEPHLREERGLYHGRCAGVVRPGSTAEVAAVVAACAAQGVPIVTQGGNTGLVGGGVPDGGIVLSTARLDRIRALDPLNRTMTVEAGVILANVQAAADGHGLLFPLSLAAEGSCRIGGNLATNAGGIAVLRYGNARDLVLGLEVVLPDGRVWDGLRALRKDNAGYDLKHLFIGSEGTLGIITATVLKLFPKPRRTETALVALAGAEAALALFHRLGSSLGDALTAFELIPRIAVDFCRAHIPGSVDPFDAPHPAYVLLRLASLREDEGLRDALEDALGAALEDGGIEDAVIAASDSQAQAFWHLRESIPEAQKHEGGSIKNDVSVPVSQVPSFIARATAACEAALPGIRVVAFGHVGDGNVHFNLSQPPGMDRERYLAEWPRLERIVCDIAAAMGGSFSAEHGVGRLKREALVRYRSATEVELMRAIKQAIDPACIMNPGKIFDPS
jgi:FAD/FMN-containing dehydrogenase